MVDDKNWLESVFKRNAYEESPLRVLDVESAAAVGKNENYLSNMTKMNVTLLLGSGKIKKMTVMVKNCHTGPVMKQFTTALGVFAREIAMYRDILPMMKDLMEECGMTDEPMWAKCYDVRLYNRLVLEDLTASGYKMSQRIQQLSLDSCLLVVRNIAKFHALSHVLLKRSEIPLDIFKNNVWKNLSHVYEEQNLKNFRTLLTTIDSWGDDWKEVRQRFEKAIPELTSKTLEAMEPDVNDFIVLNHGDCWTNNFLFRNAPNTETPISMKFVDFQLCFTGPASYDLDYLLVTSVPLENYKKHWDLIIQTYCDALKSTMLQLNYEGPVPDFTAMKTLMKRTHICFLFNAIAIVPTVLGESKDIPDYEKVFAEEREAKLRGEEGNQSWNMMRNLQGQTKTVIQFALRDAMESGLI